MPSSPPGRCFNQKFYSTDATQIAGLLCSSQGHYHALVLQGGQRHHSYYCYAPVLQGGPGVSEKRLQWALNRLASLEGRVMRLEAAAASC